MPVTDNFTSSSKSKSMDKDKEDQEKGVLYRDDNISGLDGVLRLLLDNILVFQ